MRIMCLDVGTKRIGVALSDELGITAGAHSTIERNGLKRDIKKIHEIIKSNNVEKVVVGMPYNLDGTEGKMANTVRELIKALQSSITIDVQEWDERFSTMAVSRVMNQTEMSRKKKLKVIDELSAVYILQGYLDSIRR